MNAPILATPIFATLGCRLNAYETEAMKDLAAAAGLQGAVIVNTCAVTAEAVRKAKQEIRRLSREHPGAPVIVTGCAAQTEPETFAEMPEVTRVIGNHEKMQAIHKSGMEKLKAILTDEQFAKLGKMMQRGPGGRSGEQGGPGGHPPGEHGGEI